MKMGGFYPWPDHLRWTVEAESVALQFSIKTVDGLNLETNVGDSLVAYRFVRRIGLSPYPAP
jgi:hypothetical protein